MVDDDSDPAETECYFCYAMRSRDFWVNGHPACWDCTRRYREKARALSVGLTPEDSGWTVVG